MTAKLPALLLHHCQFDLQGSPFTSRTALPATSLLDAWAIDQNSNRAKGNNNAWALTSLCMCAHKQTLHPRRTIRLFQSGSIYNKMSATVCSVKLNCSLTMLQLKRTAISAAITSASSRRVCHRNCTLVLASGVKGLIELSVRHRLAGETLVQVPKSLLSSLSERLQSHARDYISTPRLPQLLPANCNCEAPGHLRASEIACGVIDELVPKSIHVPKLGSWTIRSPDRRGR